MIDDWRVTVIPLIFFLFELCVLQINAKLLILESFPVNVYTDTIRWVLEIGTKNIFTKGNG